MTVDKKILPKIQLKTKLTKTHPIFVKNTVAVLLLVVKVAAPHIYCLNSGYAPIGPLERNGNR